MEVMEQLRHEVISLLLQPQVEVGGTYRGASESHVMFETVGNGANNGNRNRQAKTALPVN